MMQTVYVAMDRRVPYSEPPDWESTDGLWGTTGKRTARLQPSSPAAAAHLDPLCSRLYLKRGSNSTIVAVPGTVDTDHVRLQRWENTGQTLALCASCRGYRQPPIEDQTWRREALCVPENRPAGYRHVSWMPLESGSSWEHRVNAKAAREVCLLCPVSAECYLYAIQTGQTVGIWGGVSVNTGRHAAVLARYRKKGTAQALPLPLSCIYDDTEMA